jgi:hypothetical protein
MLTEKNPGCPRSRAFRDLGFHKRVTLGILFERRTARAQLRPFAREHPELALPLDTIRCEVRLINRENNGQRFAFCQTHKRGVGKIQPLALFRHIFPVRLSQTQSESRNNSPTVEHRKRCPSPETDPSSAAKHLRRLFDKKNINAQIKQQKRPPCTSPSARQIAETPTKSLFM